MLSEILMCLSVLTDDIDYGTPRQISELHFALDLKKTDIFYVAHKSEFYKCTSEVPLNQTLQIVLSSAISALPEKIQYIQADQPTQQSSQKNLNKPYKPANNLLFKHEKISAFNPRIYSKNISRTNCIKTSESDLDLKSAFVQKSRLEILDTLADWSEHMDGEDYGYDKKPAQKESDKKAWTQKLKNNLANCGKSSELAIVSDQIIQKLDLFLGTQNQTKAASKPTPVQKSSVPVRN
jgi:hypothetical protein